MIGTSIAAAVFALDAYTIFEVLRSGKRPGRKAVWIVLILLLPVVGPCLFYVPVRRRPPAGAAAGAAQ